MIGKFNMLGSLALIALSFVGYSVSAREDAGHSAKEPMPYADEDVLWVQSIPPGATVFVVEKEKGQFMSPSTNAKDANGPSLTIWDSPAKTDQHRTGPCSTQPIGKTPVRVKRKAGIYRIAVQLDVSLEKIPFEYAELAWPDANVTQEVYINNGHDAVGNSDMWDRYLNDGNIEVWGLARNGMLRKVTKTYEVEKKEGQTTAIIALFQRKDQDPNALYKTCEGEYNCETRSFLHRAVFKTAGLPKSVSEAFTERLCRGGKALFREEEFCIVAELTPIDRVAKDTRSGGCTLRLRGFPRK